MPTIEVIDDRLVVWTMTSGTLTIAIDGVVQDTCSHTVALPAEMFDTPVRDFVYVGLATTPQRDPVVRHIFLAHRSVPA